MESLRAAWDAARELPPHIVSAEQLPKHDKTVYRMQDLLITQVCLTDVGLVG